MKRRILFRVDANSKIGRGHLSRCAAVASMISDVFNIEFVILNENRAYIQNLALNWNIRYINTNDDILNIINQEDMVWLDGYSFSEEFKSQLQSKVFKLIETNDIPYAAKNVDIIFNHTPGISKAQFPDTTSQLFLGLDYSMLRPSFLQYALNKKQSKTGEGVFICFGGADTSNLGEKFVNGLNENKFESPIYWVRNNTSDGITFSNNNINVLHNLSEDDMVTYMLKCKVLLVPSSVLSFETIALRKPFFTCYFVDNQKLIFEGLKKLQLAECFGFINDDQDVNDAVKDFMLFYKNDTYQSLLVEKQRLHLRGNSKESISNVLLAS